MKKRLFAVYFLLLLTGPLLPAQSFVPDPAFLRSLQADTLAPRPRTAADYLSEGDSLHRSYRFEQALQAYETGAGMADAALEATFRDRRRAVLSALALADVCTSPRVVARQRFSREDFYLFYPLRSQSWRTCPNILDSSPDGPPVYAPKGVRTIYFSALDATGARNLYVTADRDTVWSAPALLGEKVLSAGNEIYPMLSADAQTLYFASDGLQGMGGYDLYRSRWDEAEKAWGPPENLGFPYSSPADDFLLTDTEDGKYTLLASNRSCSADSVYLYVLEKQQDAPRFPLPDADALARLSALLPVADPTVINNASALPGETAGNDNTLLYMHRMEEARALRDSIYHYERLIDDLRLRLTRGVADERVSLTASIADQEEALVPFRKALDEVNSSIRTIEQSFLRSGVVSVSDRSDREVVGASSGYTFSKSALGARLRLKIEPKPAPRDMQFRITPVGRFSQDKKLPEGIVYQIEIFSSPRHATLDDIHGLQPVYERLTSSLRYVYSVGIFRTYEDALEHLNAVRRQGFPEARITAFRDGIPLSVSEARAGE